MAATRTLTHACVQSDFYTPNKGIVVVSGLSHLPGASVIGNQMAGVFASASLWALRLRKDVDIFDICSTALSKTPKPWSKVICWLGLQYFVRFRYYLEGVWAWNMELIPPLPPPIFSMCKPFIV